MVAPTAQVLAGDAPAATVPVGTAAGNGAPLARPLPSRGIRGWIGPIVVTLIAGILRFAELGRPRDVIFDETYYVKDALSLLRFGYERQTVPDANEIILEGSGRWNDLDIFTDSPSFVVHPPVGKWVIASGEWVFGVTPFGWRFAVALLGTLSVLMVARSIRRLTRSDVVGTLAGLLVALDGLHLVMSRTALLDLTLMVMVLAAWSFLLLDRDAVRFGLQRRGAAGPAPTSSLGPGLGIRPWRLAAGVSLGLACGVKWSGLWFVAAFGLLAVAWDLQLRRRLGVRHPVRGVVLLDVAPAFASLVGLAAVVYVGTWAGWLLTDGGYDRQWAASHPGPAFVPEALRSLAEYHRAAWVFHVGLDSPHSYRSSALSWPFMTRPTSFSYESAGLECGTDKCSAEVLALGNPVLWWAGVLALGHNAWRAIAARDWRSGALLVGYLAGWLPWLVFHDRTIFTFYAIVLVPFLAGLVAMSLARLPGGVHATPGRRRVGLMTAGTVVVLVVVAAWFFLPIWTGVTLPYEHWHWRMWMPTWV